MIISRKSLKLFLLISVLILPALCFAVTQKEMEQARTIAAKAYLRYANDGSGYLDDLNPATMEELEASLKPKEKENIKAFKAIPVPGDYQNWNRDKLVEYWAVDAFKTKGLIEKGRGGRIRARSQINKMTLVNPATVSQELVTAQPSTPEQSQLESDNPSGENAGQGLQGLESIPQVDPSMIDNLDEETEVKKASNYTWVYIMVLVILVAIVIALVVYAANVMKKSSGPKTLPATPNRNYERPAESTRQYENMIADRDMEISMLKKKLESAARQNSELKTRIEALTSELEGLKSSRRVEAPVSRPAQVSPATSGTNSLKSIYLGRANSRGVFVRADRSLNPGQTVFVLDTADGFSGSFRVVDSPEVFDLVLSNPVEYLGSACVGQDLDDPGQYVSRIVTEASGTAVFEGGCWRVIRKARIRYEI